MKKEVAENIVNQYLDGVTNSDVKRIMSLYANNCVVEDPVGGDVQEGYAAVKAFYGNLKDVNLKAQLSGAVRVTDAGNVIAFPFQVEVDLGDSTLVQDIIDVFYCDENDKIIKMQAFWGSENSVMQ